VRDTGPKRLGVSANLTNRFGPHTMHRSNLSLVSSVHAGTFLSALYFWGKYSFSRSSGSIFSHASLSSLDLHGMLASTLQRDISGVNLREILLGRVVAHVVTRRRQFRRRNVHWVNVLGLLVLPQVKVNLLFLFLLSLALLRGLIRQDSAFSDSLDQLHDLLGFVLGGQEAPLGFRGTAERCWVSVFIAILRSR